MRLLVAGATAMLVLGIFGLISLGLKSDWLAYYAAGRFLLDGRLAQVYDLPILQGWQAQVIGQNITPFLYPPAYALPFAPLALLPPWTARISWLLACLCAGFFAVRLSTRWSGLSLPVSLVALLAFPPFAYSLAVGQISPITLLIFTGVAALEWVGGRDGRAGLLAGLALYKPQQLIPLAVSWLAARRWRNLVGMATTGLLIAALSFLLDPRSPAAYLRMTRSFLGLANQSTVSGANISLFAWSPWLGVFVLAGVLAVLILVQFKGDRRLGQALLWLAPVLVAPYLVIYDMLLLALPLSLLVPLLRKDRLLQAGVSLLWLACLLAPFIVATCPVTWAALLLYLMIAWRAFRPQSPDSQHAATDAPASTTATGGAPAR
jgi:hypothetical protein